MAKDHKMEVLSLGLFRTGTASTAEAYKILGYKKVHHGLDSITDPTAWADIDHAADATFRTLPTYQGGDAHLERIFDGYNVVTDIACFFAEQLIRQYPTAKVVLTTRDFDSWARSVNDVVLPAEVGLTAWLIRNMIEPLTGDRLYTAAFKILRGLLGAESQKASYCRANLRRVYDEHHEMVTRLVPKERLLVWKVSEGWEPLCRFLGKPVPERAFPRINEAASLKRKHRDTKRRVILKAFLKLSATMMAIAVTCWAITRGLSR